MKKESWLKKYQKTYTALVWTGLIGVCAGTIYLDRNSQDIGDFASDCVESIESMFEDTSESVYKTFERIDDKVKQK